MVDTGPVYIRIYKIDLSVVYSRDNKLDIEPGYTSVKNQTHER